MSPLRVIVPTTDGIYLEAVKDITQEVITVAHHKRTRKQ